MMSLDVRKKRWVGGSGGARTCSRAALSRGFVQEEGLPGHAVAACSTAFRYENFHPNKCSPER
jgi:hypothetical protein